MFFGRKKKEKKWTIDYTKLTIIQDNLKLAKAYKDPMIDIMIKAQEKENRDILKNLDSLQVKSILAALVWIAVVDGEILNKYEKQFFVELQKTIEYNNQDLEDAIAFNLEEAVSVLSSFDLPQKVILKDMLQDIASTDEFIKDQVINDEEQILLDILYERIGLNDLNE